MRPAPVPSPAASAVRLRPITGARMAVWLAAAVLGVVLGLNLGLPLPHPARSPRGLAQSNQAEVAVLLFPDLDGSGDFAPDCPGCDGQFGSGDLFLAERNPVPRLDVTLTDPSGSRLTMRTRTLAPGRQQTLFRVDAPGTYTVTLAALSTEWQLCPRAADPLVVGSADFDASTHRAQLIVPLTHVCRRDEASATPASTATETAMATDGPTAAATAASPTATASVGDGAAAGDGDPTAGATDGDGREPSANVETAGSLAPGPLAADASADVTAAPSLPQTGLSGPTPLRQSIRFAWLAVCTAVLGAGGWRRQRRRIPRRRGRWLRWSR